ncbi:MAG: hypothetical protein QW228_06015 [Candidatus Aenigmatarchaeota archaeon]
MVYRKRDVVVKSVVLTKKLDEEVKVFLQYYGLSFSEVVRSALIEFLKGKERVKAEMMEDIVAQQQSNSSGQIHSS